MILNKVAREQQIAVFGESGSGKTVLLSSFYGLALEGLLSGTERFDVLAGDSAQGRLLHQNYLGMKNSAALPMTNRFSATSYAFAIKRKPGAAAKAKKHAAEELRLVWHDYPGEWFEEDPTEPEEEKRRIDTFRSLLGSDVALVLVDGQKLLDNAGEEERYLKALLTNLSTQLLKVRDNLLEDSKPLVKFPRIWLMALSKADLLPNMDVVNFQDMLVEKAGAELNKLQSVIASFVEAPEALSVGDDFVLLSSAEFEPGKIEIAKRVGLDLMLPIAAMLPFSRYVRWAFAARKGGAVAEHLLQVATPLAALLAQVKLPTFLVRAAGPLGPIARLVSPNLIQVVLDLAGDKVKDLHVEASGKHDFLTETLTGFQLELDEGEAGRVLLRSRT
ncbi:TRAFAC clade GTPase domain-containing protein [Arthrobacter sp. TmT3-37]